MENILYLFIGLIGIIFFVVVIFIFMRSMKQTNTPTSVSKVKVISKRKVITDPTAMLSIDELGKNWYYITFEIEQMQQEFRVNKRVYNEINEGDVGKLYHKEDIFVNFEKNWHWILLQ